MNTQKNKTWIAGVLLAVSASLCCITPVLALLSGVGGIAATFSWLEPARPFLISFTVLVLGFAWYQKLKPRKQEEIDCACEDETRPSFLHSKNFLSVVTILAIGLLTFPSYSHIFYSNNNEKHAVITNKSSFITADFSIDGMTCTSCEEHIQQAVNGLAGVLESTANYNEGTAQVKFDSDKISVDKISEAINETGYTVVEFKIKNFTASGRKVDSIEKIQVSIKGMTCSGCEEHVRQAVIGLEGIIETSISYKEGNAVIRYDASKTSLEKIKEAINGTGYKVIDSKSIVDAKDI